VRSAVPRAFWMALCATLLFWGSSFPAIAVALDGYPPVELTLLRYAVASLLLLGVALVRHPQLPARRDLPALAGLGLLGIVGYVSGAYVLSKAPVSLAAGSLYAVPVLAFAIAWLWLGQVPSALTLIGGAVAIAGVALVNLFGRAPARA